MQYAFRGHMVVLCDEFTASDGEAFTEGLPPPRPRQGDRHAHVGRRNLAVGEQLARRRGIATAAETGVYGPEGEWLIEGHGVDPDIVVDNLPHATFNGEGRAARAPPSSTSRS